VKTRILTIAGSKGGTGKSALLVQLGILLAEQGARVILVDGDLSGANLHTFFGLEDPDAHLDAVLLGRQELLSSILPTGVPGLAMLPGVRRDLQPPVSQEHFRRWFRELRQLEADWVLVDAGSGTSPWNLQLAEGADLCLLTLNPEPTSIEREIRFVRGFCRFRLQSLSGGESFPASGWLPVPWLAAIRRKKPQLASQLQAQLRRAPVGLILNQVRTPEDRELAEDCASVYRRFFGLDCHNLGWLPFDERLWLSIRERRPAVLEYPQSRWTESVQRLVRQLLQESLWRSQS
jgi:flagellar biosynthesis protein FlhG